MISGGTGSGKTTFLNNLSKFIPANERLVTIEDSAELMLQRKHVVKLETRPKSAEGTAEVSQRDLVRTPSACVPTGSFSAKSAAAKRSTCSRR
jgi:pilus assembly protein CpaF